MNSNKNRDGVTVADLWILTSMDKKMTLRGKRDDMVWWFTKVLHGYGYGAEVSKQVATLANKASDETYSYSEALNTCFKRFNRLSQK